MYYQHCIFTLRESVAVVKKLDITLQIKSFVGFIIIDISTLTMLYDKIFSRVFCHENNLKINITKIEDVQECYSMKTFAKWCDLLSMTNTLSPFLSSQPPVRILHVKTRRWSTLLFIPFHWRAVKPFYSLLCMIPMSLSRSQSIVGWKLYCMVSVYSNVPSVYVSSVRAILSTTGYSGERLVVDVCKIVCELQHVRHATGALISNAQFNPIR